MPSFYKKSLMWPWQDIRVKSKVNGEIKIKFFFGRPAVWVGGYEQSGPMVHNLWKKSLKSIDEPHNVLILGLGCGEAAKIISEKFPQAKITGIEIDPVIIDIGKKYFGLDRIPNLKIVLGDANKSLPNGKFDLVLVDIYKGNRRVKTKNVDKLLTKNGLAIFNVLEKDTNKLVYSQPKRHDY